jgi:hypothetical protein
MERWAAYLRGQADALNLPVVYTGSMTLAESTQCLERLVRGLLEAEDTA